MAQSAPAVCKYAGCLRITYDGYCPEHKRKKQRRPSSTRRGYDYRWQKVRAAFLRAHPVCQIRTRCNGEAATEVDHKVAIADGGANYDHGNLRASCKRCHSRKTVLEDGGFGRARRR